MAGTISMNGLASGMDVSGLIDALVSANSLQKIAMQNRVTLASAASTNISGIASLLSKLKSSVDALSDADEIQSYKATSSNSAIEVSVTGAANGGRYDVEVKSLAQEYRAYSSQFASTTSGLGQGGIMSIQVGSAAATPITITEGDSLDSIVSKINSTGIGVTASTFYDGSQYRLQLRGDETGAGNEVTVTGLDLGLNLTGNFKQQAASAHLVIDDFDVYSKTNEVTGAIPGVTLKASKLTDSAATVEVLADPASVQSKLQSVVDAYNAVVNKVHSVAGYGTTTATDKTLAGDSTLRGLTARMSSTILTVVGDDSNYQTLNSIGVSLNRDGTMSLDATKLSKALNANPTAVNDILAGTATSDGVMDIMNDVVDLYNRTGDGLLANKKNALDASVKRLQTQITNEESRLDNYRALLEKQFQVMEDAYSAANTTSSYLTALSSS